MNVIQGIDLPNDLVATYVLDVRPGITGVSVSPATADWPITGIKEWFGTSAIEGKPTRDIGDRLTRCNELTWYAMMYGDAGLIPQSRLVHGSIDGRGRIADAKERIQHSWLLIRARRATLVWEPITATLTLRDDWYEFAKAWEEREYTLPIVKSMTRTEGHYGPWHESRYP